MRADHQQRRRGGRKPSRALQSPIPGASAIWRVFLCLLLCLRCQSWQGYPRCRRSPACSTPRRRGGSPRACRRPPPAAAPPPPPPERRRTAAALAEAPPRQPRGPPSPARAARPPRQPSPRRRRSPPAGRRARRSEDALQSPHQARAALRHRRQPGVGAGAAGSSVGGDGRGAGAHERGRAGAIDTAIHDYHRAGVGDPSAVAVSSLDL